MRIMGTKTITIVFLVSVFMTAITGIALAKDEVGSLVALRGKTIINREAKVTEARVKDNILFNDTVSTLEASKAKMLFIDDSVLTLGEKSKVVIKEFIYSKEKGGKSIFNLIDGKMRAVVGKTGFEVRTATSVAAARGTIIYFITGVLEDGRKFTTIICLEGVVDLTGAPGISGSVSLTAGMMVTMIEGEPMPMPVAVPASLLAQIQDDTDLSGNEISIPGPAYLTIGPGKFDVGEAPLPNFLPLVDQQPVNTAIPVNINLTFPQ